MTPRTRGRSFAAAGALLVVAFAAGIVVERSRTPAPASAAVLARVAAKNEEAAMAAAARMKAESEAAARDADARADSASENVGEGPSSRPPGS